MNNKIIIYDDNCPLCAAYTNAFVQTGLIDQSGRKNFSNIAPEILMKIDLERCKNEIPLIDANSNQVWYGLDALLEILQQKIPFAKTIGNAQPVKWLLQKLYKFISFNRRVIVAGKSNDNQFDCTPDFNSRYRIAFIVTFLLFNTLMLFPLQHNVLSKSIFTNSNIIQLQWAHTAFVSINIIVALLLKKKTGLEFLGQISMTALLLVLVSIPLILINKYTGADALFNSFYLGGSALFVLQEYVRRMKFIDFFNTHRAIILLNVCSMTAFIIYLAQ